MGIPTNPAVYWIVANWLRANGYDGLCLPDEECGCGLDDLMPCENADQCIDHCQAAYACTLPDDSPGWGLECDGQGYREGYDDEDEG